MSSISIIGPGRHGTAIGALFASHGVDVTVYHHNPAKAQAARESIASVAENATVSVAADLASAAAASDVIALTTLWDAPQRAVIGALGDSLTGKVLLDVSNPLDVTPQGVVARTPEEGSAGQFVATLLPAGAGHAKAFSNLATAFITESADATPPAVLPYLADSAATAEVIGPLLARTGWLPVLAGTISRSRDIEIGGVFNRTEGAHGRARLTADEFTAKFGIDTTAA